MKLSTVGLLALLTLTGCSKTPRTAPTTTPTPTDLVTVRKGRRGPELTVSPETQDRLGIQCQPLKSNLQGNQIEAYGSVEEDPGGRSLLAAPVAGILASSSWPHLGQTLQRDAPLGSVTTRVLPTERAQVRSQRLDFETRLQSALSETAQAVSLVGQTDAELRGARAALNNAKITYQRAQELNALDKNLSDRALRDARQRYQEADARVSALQQRRRGEQARVQAAQSSVSTLRQNLPSVEQLEESRPLLSASDGEVVEVLAQPGQSVEAGQPLLRLASYGHVLARVEVPVGRRLEQTVHQAQIEVPGEKRRYVGRWIAAATAPAGAVRGQSLVFSLNVPDASLRPGTPVIAHLRTQASPGLEVPTGARLLDGDRTYVYRRVAPDRFERLEVDSSGHPLKPGDQVVTAGGQLLLSEERKESLEVLQEGGE